MADFGLRMWSWLGLPLADGRGVTHLHWSFSFCALYSTYIHCRDDALGGERVLLMMITGNK